MVIEFAATDLGTVGKIPDIVSLVFHIRQRGGQGAIEPTRRRKRRGGKCQNFNTCLPSS